METFEQADKFLTAITEQMKHADQIMVKEMIDGKLCRVPLSSLPPIRKLMHINAFVRARQIPLRVIS